jgi:FKBP-type peptidyl-prolyl cis-trans isomerase FklB
MPFLLSLKYYLWENLNLKMYSMKIKGLIVLTGVIALMLGSCGKSSLKSANLKSKEDSLSYAFGIVNYNYLKTDSLILDPMVVAKAMMDGKEGKPLMADDIARSYIMAFINKRETAKAAKKAEVDKVKYKDYIDQNEAFLSKNKEKAGVTTTASGLQYEVIKMGTGPKPTTQNTVKVHYVGTLIDGTEFDSSVKRKEPATFPVSGVIPGWTEALQLMPVGSKFKLYLPAAIAYGATGAGEVIKPFSTLIFEVELLEIVK